MNSVNHVLIASVVYDYIKEKYGILLDREAFILGNTCPDHSIAFLRPHRRRYCAGMVRKKTVRLCRGKWGLPGRKASKKIGILCHYYSDFFCRAHNPDFGGLKKHRQYEAMLLRYMQENYDLFRRIDYISGSEIPRNAAEISRRMDLLLREKPAVLDGRAGELVCAVQACAELVLAVCLAVLARKGTHAVAAA